MKIYHLKIIHDGDELDHIVFNDIAKALSMADALITAMPGRYEGESVFTFSRADAAATLTDPQGAGSLSVKRPDGSTVSVTVDRVDKASTQSM